MGGRGGGREQLLQSLLSGYTKIVAFNTFQGIIAFNKIPAEGVGTTLR